jgi:hypothetical protein
MEWKISGRKPSCMTEARLLTENLSGGKSEILELTQQSLRLWHRAHSYNHCINKIQLMTSTDCYMFRHRIAIFRESYKTKDTCPTCPTCPTRQSTYWQPSLGSIKYWSSAIHNLTSTNSKCCDIKILQLSASKPLQYKLTAVKNAY